MTIGLIQARTGMVVFRSFHVKHCHRVFRHPDLHKLRRSSGNLTSFNLKIFNIFLLRHTDLSSAKLHWLLSCRWTMVYIHVAHVAATLSSCVSCSLILQSGNWDGDVGVFCVFCWTFSFSSSLLILLMEMIAFCHWVRPVCWRNVSTTICSYATLYCLNASIIYPGYFLSAQEDKGFYSQCVVAEIFSCIATLGHLVEVWIVWTEPKCYMASGPGLLQVSQTYVASAIFFFLANAVSFKDHPAVIWSLAVYCLCFVCTLANIICCAFQDHPNQKWMKGFNLSAAVIYLSAFWPVFQLSQNLGQTGSCQDDLGLWPDTRLTVVLALTVLNVLLYLLGVCCCCMLHRNDDEEQIQSRRASGSGAHPSQTSDERQSVLPAEPRRALQPYNTIVNNQAMSRQDLKILPNFVSAQTINVQIINNYWFKTNWEKEEHHIYWFKYIMRIVCTACNPIYFV